MKKIFSILIVSIGCCGIVGNLSAAKTTKSKGISVVKKGATLVRERVAPSGIYNQECYEKYYGCMDQFCVGDSAVLNIPGEAVTLDGGTCACSDDNQGFKDKITKMNEKLSKANTLKTVEVEKVEAGAKADIIFKGEREYDDSGNVIVVDKKSAQEKLLSLWDVDEEEDEEEEINISDYTGSELYSNAQELCLAQMPDSCSKDINFLTSLYSTQIKSDCKAFDNTIVKMQAKVDTEYASAEKAVRDARLSSFESANQYDRGTCMLNFRKCMSGADVCGSDWTNCVNFIAAENMQNNKRTSDVSSQTVEHISKYEITDTTLEMLEAKRNICENVLDKCMAVRDNVWDDFLREVAPSLKIAELNAESNLRQSCLSDISDCVQKACKDDIEGKGVATMDACLSRPDMARSFCKIQIEKCERMEPLIWGYVVDKLASMRVDRCTQEVKDCFTERCGDDFSDCIGMDYDYMHDICPLDKLVVCKKNNPNFSMNDIDSMLMGLYLNIDNSALENCQNVVNTKMLEVCGSTTDCNVFAADDTIGTGSLRNQKNGNIYRVTGMISFGNIKIDDASMAIKDGTKELSPGQIGVQEYIDTAKAKNVGVENEAGILDSINAELTNIAGTINRTIDLIEQDPKVSYCINGRDLSQITGKKEQTSARFPNLLNQTKMLIAASALRKAQDNYNTKFNKMISDATKDASADLAQYMCQMMPMNGGASSGNLTDLDTPLAPTYAISYDVGAGLTTDQLLQGGHDSSSWDGVSLANEKSTTKDRGKYKLKEKDRLLGLILPDKTKEKSKTNSRTVDKKYRVETPGGYKEMWSLFNRDTRTCHYCVKTVISNCETTGKKGWFKDTRGVSCKTTSEPEVCEDIQM